jgi:Tfp pilus assembly protein PilF
MRTGRIDPNIAGPYYVKALAYRNLGDVRRSIETCRAALAITPHEGLRRLLRSLAGGG